MLVIYHVLQYVAGSGDRGEMTAKTDSEFLQDHEA